MGPGETFATLFLFSIPLLGIWTSHKRKMLEIQLRLKQEADADVRASVDSLREEVRNLRETAMQYDLSFDNALQRMEQRVENLERNAQSARSDNVASLRVGQ